MAKVESGFQISAKNYIKAAGTLAVMAQNITGVPIPRTTLQTWEQMMYAIRVGDDRLDRICDQGTRSGFKKQMMGCLRNEAVSFGGDNVLEEAMVNLRQVCDSLPDTKRALLLRTFDRLLIVTELIRQVSDIQAFSILTRLEGQITSKLFLAVLPEGYSSQATYRSLHKTFTRLGRFADVFDSFSDLSDDHAEGLTKVVPSLINRGRLLINSFPDAVVVLRYIRPTTYLIGQIGKRVLETAQNNPHRGKQVSIDL